MKQNYSYILFITVSISSNVNVNVVIVVIQLRVQGGQVIVGVLFYEGAYVVIAAQLSRKIKYTVNNRRTPTDHYQSGLVQELDSKMQIQGKQRQPLQVQHDFNKQTKFVNIIRE